MGEKGVGAGGAGAGDSPTLLGRVPLFGLETGGQFNLVNEHGAVGVVGIRAEGSGGAGGSPAGGLQEKSTVVLIFIEPATQ